MSPESSIACMEGFFRPSSMIPPISRIPCQPWHRSRSATLKSRQPWRDSPSGELPCLRLHLLWHGRHNLKVLPLQSMQRSRGGGAVTTIASCQRLGRGRTCACCLSRTSCPKVLVHYALYACNTQCVNSSQGWPQNMPRLKSRPSSLNYHASLIWQCAQLMIAWSEPSIIATQSGSSWHPHRSAMVVSAATSEEGCGFASI